MPHPSFYPFFWIIKKRNEEEEKYWKDFYERHSIKCRGNENDDDSPSTWVYLILIMVLIICSSCAFFSLYQILTD